MTDAPYEVADYVINPRMPEWGPGKILEVRGSTVRVYFRDIVEERRGDAVKTIKTTVVKLEPAGIAHDPLLDGFAESTGTRKRSRLPRLTLDQGIGVSKSHFHGGFDDAKYRSSEGERLYKEQTHELWKETLGGDTGEQLLQAGGVKELTTRLLRVEAKLDLLSKYEKIALRNGLADPTPALSFFERLFDLIRGGELRAETFEPYCHAVRQLPAGEGRARVFTWPIATLFPFVARPDCFMFLKPDVTNACADNLAIDLQYRSDPNWITYEKLMELADFLLSQLRPLGARDYIDVQSFIWVIGAYDRT